MSCTPAASDEVSPFVSDVTTDFALAHNKLGPRYQVEGRLKAPDGRSPRVRSVWQLDHGEVEPRLIKAYPLLD